MDQLLFTGRRHTRDEVMAYLEKKMQTINFHFTFFCMTLPWQENHKVMYFRRLSFPTNKDIFVFHDFHCDWVSNLNRKNRKRQIKIPTVCWYLFGSKIAFYVHVAHFFLEGNKIYTELRVLHKWLNWKSWNVSGVTLRLNETWYRNYRFDSPGR